MGWISTHEHRVKITIASAAPLTGDLTDQSVVVHLDNTRTDFWNNSPPVAGSGVRFTAADGTTLLNFEVESYDATGHDAWWHVQITTLSGTVNTDIYIYFKALSESAGDNKTATWDSDYVSVYHLNADKPEGAFDDSTANNNDLTNYGTTDAVAAVDKGRDFIAVSSQYLTFPDIDFSNGVVTGTCSFTPDSVTPAAAYMLVSQGDGLSSTIESQLAITAASKLRITLNTAGGGTKITESTTTLVAGTQYHAVWRYDGTSLKLYINGSDVTSVVTDSGSGAMYDKNALWYIGGRSDGYYFDGRIDEVTLSNAVRSADWIAARYQSYLTTWVSFSTIEKVIILEPLDVTDSMPVPEVLGAGISITIEPLDVTDFIPTPNIVSQELLLSADGFPSGKTVSYKIVDDTGTVVQDWTSTGVSEIVIDATAGVSTYRVSTLALYPGFQGQVFWKTNDATPLIAIDTINYYTTLNIMLNETAWLNKANIIFLKKWVLNRFVEGPAGTFTIYDDDGATILAQWQWDSSLRTRTKMVG